LSRDLPQSRNAARIGHWLATTTGRNWASSWSTSELGFAAYDTGQIDAFELDEIIHQYKRATVELWKFCVGLGSGSGVELAAHAIELARAEGADRDWWEAGAPRKTR
jgi:hypothetical protein